VTGGDGVDLIVFDPSYLLDCNGADGQASGLRDEGGFRSTSVVASRRVSGAAQLGKAEHTLQVSLCR
jgi:hypothetical protein